MDPELPASWQIFVEQYPQVMKAYRRLAKTDWFAEGRWVGFVGHYTHGIYLQIYKAHWYNQDLNGIHFELALDANCLERRVASIQLHITHKNLLPDREAFNRYTIPRMVAMVDSWDDRYELSTTKLSERLNLGVPFSKSSFAQKIETELSQVCQLGSIIDAAISNLWGVDCA